MRKRKLAFVAGGVGLVLAASGCGLGASSSSSAGGSSSSGASSGPVQIAVLEPFSGAEGYLGSFVQNSIQIEVNQINASGGLLGRKVQVITRDDQANPQDAVSAARELAADPNVAMIAGPSITALYQAVRPVYEQAQKLNCPLSVDDTSAVQGAKYTFLAGPYNSLYEEAMLSYLQKHHVTTLGVVYSNDATGTSTASSLSALAPKYGIKYLGVQYYDEGAPDQLKQVQALKSAGAIWISGIGADAAETAISAQQVGYKGMLIGSDGLQSYVFVDSGAAAGSTYASEALYYLTNTPQSQWPAAYRSFIDTATTKYGVVKGKSGVTQLKGTPLSAACVVAWAAAVKKAGTFDATKVADAWQTLSIPASQDPDGIALHFTPSNHDFYQNADQLAIYQWTHQGDKWFLQTLQAPSGG